MFLTPLLRLDKMVSEDLEEKSKDDKESFI